MNYRIYKHETDSNKFIMDFAEIGKKFFFTKDEIKPRLDKTIVDPQERLKHAIKVVAKERGVFALVEKYEKEPPKEKEKSAKKSSGGSRKAKVDETKVKIKKYFIDSLKAQGVEIEEEKNGEFQFDFDGKHYTVKLVENKKKA